MSFLLSKLSEIQVTDFFLYIFMMFFQMRLKIRIRDINPHIVCSLCAGYFVDATTIMECLHTCKCHIFNSRNQIFTINLMFIFIIVYLFLSVCKSCIVKYLQTSKFCPQCNIKIHETQPLMNLKPDRVMQDIVYKLVPGLYEGNIILKGVKVW